MKKIHLIGIVVIAVAIAILISAAGDVSTYATFKDAMNSGDKVKVCAHLSKDKPMEYNPSKDPNYFSFYVYHLCFLHILIMIISLINRRIISTFNLIHSDYKCHHDKVFDFLKNYKN